MLQNFDRFERLLICITRWRSFGYDNQEVIERLKNPHVLEMYHLDLDDNFGVEILKKVIELIEKKLL